MGMVIAFPGWKVVTRDEGTAPGDPIAIVEPSGSRLLVTRILRRRLVASPDPAEPIWQETMVETADGRHYVVRFVRQEDRWDVKPI